MNALLTNLSASVSLTVGHPFNVTLAASGTKTLPVSLEHFIGIDDTKKAALLELDRQVHNGKLSITWVESPTPVNTGIVDSYLSFVSKQSYLTQPVTGATSYVTADGVIAQTPILICPTGVALVLMYVDLFQTAVLNTDGTNYVTLTLVKTNAAGATTATLATVTNNSSGGAAITAGRNVVTITPTSLAAGESLCVIGAKGGTGSALVGGIQATAFVNPAAQVAAW